MPAEQLIVTGHTPNITNRYDNASLSYGIGRLWQSETSGSEGTLVTVNSFDSLGRALSQSQQFKTGGVWSTAYTTQQSYRITGSLSSQTYPSGHTTSFGYDSAGRLSSFAGNLGDGVSRNYSNNIVYDAGSRMLEEQYGTQTALYHKLQYNQRGQLYDVRLSTLSRAQSLTVWDRGCLAFYYSVNNQAWGGSGTDNSGNVTKAEIYVPNSDGSYNMQQDQYTYDSLNRLQSVNELQWGTEAVFTQAFTYDRWGNRQINQAASSTNVNTQQFGIDTSNNRLGVPSGQSGQMTYDAAGNLTADTYSRADTSRVYDGENRLVTNTDTSNQVSRYTYDASGKRVRRNINNQETWQVYGIGGELIAEYAANASPSSVQKEYGYRGGELLVTATSGAEVQWLIGDHLGTPRMIADKTGTLTGVMRHDYLPFGEEIGAGVGSRNTDKGFSQGDMVRQKYAGMESDDATGMAHTLWRKQDNLSGRWTGPDPYGRSMTTADPQSFNRYTYVNNDPVNLNDPTGLVPYYGADQGWGNVEDGWWGMGDLNNRPHNEEHQRILNEFTSDVRYIVRMWLGPENDQGDFPSHTEIVYPHSLSAFTNPTITDDMKNYLKKTESLELVPYSRDGSAGGNCTVGYGHFIRAGACTAADFKEYKDFTQVDAEALFELDLLDKGINVVQANITVDLNEYQFDALVSFAFRLGRTRFAKSETVEKINQGDYVGGGDKILDWGRGRGQKKRALVEWMRFNGANFNSNGTMGPIPRSLP